MLYIGDITESVAYQEILAEGISKGEIKGKIEGQLEGQVKGEINMLDQLYAGSLLGEATYNSQVEPLRKKLRNLEAEL